MKAEKRVRLFLIKAKKEEGDRGNTYPTTFAACLRA